LIFIYSGNSVEFFYIPVQYLNTFSLLFHGSDVKTDDAALYLIAFCHRFGLSEVASSELLCLCNHLLPIGSNMPKTIHKLKQCVGIEKVALKEKRYCQVCKSEMFTSNFKGSKKNDWKCNNKDCQGSNNVEYDSFFYVDIAPQLEDLVKSNFEVIKSYSNEKRQNIDLIDGLYYSALKKENTLHLMVFSDGTPIKKSTYKQFWPVFVGICELPRILRESFRNKIISGIWFGKTKPTSDILFEPLINDL
jgi:hypothetical protein